MYIYMFIFMYVCVYSIYVVKNIGHIVTQVGT